MAPLLIIRSARLNNTWANASHVPEFTLDGCDADFYSSAYLTWSGPEFALSIDSFHLRGLFNDVYRSATATVLRVTEKTVTITTFDIDKDFLDFCYVADQARHLPRFVPDESYVQAKMAPFPADIRKRATLHWGER